MSNAVAAWRWLAANGLQLLVAVCWCVLACTIVLAIIAFANSRRIRHLARESKRQAALLKALTARVQSQAERFDAAAVSPVPAPSSEQKRDPAALACVREELVRLQAELAAPDPRDAAQAPPQPDALPDPDSAGSCRTALQND